MALNSSTRSEYAMISVGHTVGKEGRVWSGSLLIRKSSSSVSSRVRNLDLTKGKVQRVEEEDKVLALFKWA